MSPMIARINAVVWMSFCPIRAVLSPGRKMKLILSKIVSPSILTVRFSTVKRSLPISRSALKLINGYLRLDGTISSSSILSSIFLRDVACLDLEALAEKRATNSCNCLIFSSALALRSANNLAASSEDSFQKS